LGAAHWRRLSPKKGYISEEVVLKEVLDDRALYFQSFFFLAFLERHYLPIKVFNSIFFFTFSEHFIFFQKIDCPPLEVLKHLRRFVPALKKNID